PHSTKYFWRRGHRILVPITLLVPGPSAPGSEVVRMPAASPCMVSEGEKCLRRLSSFLHSALAPVSHLFTAKQRTGKTGCYYGECALRIRSRHRHLRLRTPATTGMLCGRRGPYNDKLVGTGGHDMSQKHFLLLTVVALLAGAGC